MKTSPRTEAHIHALVQNLFRRWPSLVGFCVQDNGDLVIGDLEMQPWSAETHELVGEVAGALLEFVDEEPAAIALLRGRTFARTLH
jgi:hypothetical protein